MIYVARWAFNMGVETAFKNPKLPLRNSYTILTKLRYKHVWLLKYALVFLRANYADGYKAVNLARKTRRDKKLANLKSAHDIFRTSHNGMQPAINSYQFPKLKNGTLNIGTCILQLVDDVDADLVIKSFQIVETTKKIMTQILPEDRTYELHVQYEYTHPECHEGDVISIDLNTTNMFGFINISNGTSGIMTLPDDAKRIKHDWNSKLQSWQSSLHKGGCKYYQVKKLKITDGKNITNRKKNAVRKALVKLLINASVVIIEDLKIGGMTVKGSGKRGLNRVMYYASMGFVKAEIIHYCKKHSITVILVNPAYTSVTCGVCGHIDKASRNYSDFVCTKCGHQNHADLNSPENLFHRAVSGVTDGTACKKTDTARNISLKIKKFSTDTANPEHLQFGTRRYEGYYNRGFEMHIPHKSPELLEKHKKCTNTRCLC